MRRRPLAFWVSASKRMRYLALLDGRGSRYWYVFCNDLRKPTGTDEENDWVEKSREIHSNTQKLDRKIEGISFGDACCLQMRA